MNLQIKTLTLGNVLMVIIAPSPCLISDMKYVLVIAVFRLMGWLRNAYNIWVNQNLQGCVSKELKASEWWVHLCTRPGKRRWVAVRENDFLRHYHQSPHRSGPPILLWGRTRGEGGWGQRIKLEWTKTDFRVNRLLTIYSSHNLTVLCPPFLAYLSHHTFLGFYFPFLYKMVTKAFTNGPCWSESSLQLNCIINYSAGSGLEANLKRGREIDREQELDDEMEDSCLTPPVGLCLSPLL